MSANGKKKTDCRVSIAEDMQQAQMRLAPQWEVSD
jgi:hypothetical protein